MHAIGGAVEQADGGPQQVFEIGFEAGVLERRDQGVEDVGHATTAIGANTVRANLVTTFNQLRQQLDTTAGDSSFNGVNLLIGDALKLVFNENNTSSVTIQSTSMH